MAFTDELCKNHMESLISAPSSGQMSKTGTGCTCQDENFHPNQLSLPTLQLTSRVVNGHQSTSPSLFIAMPSRRFQSIKSRLEMRHEWHGVSIPRHIGDTRWQNSIIDTKPFGRRRSLTNVHLWEWCRCPFHFLEVRFTHLVKVSLRLFTTAFHFALSGFGTVALAQAL